MNKRMKIIPTTMFAMDSSFWQYKVYSDMCYGFHARRRPFDSGAILYLSCAYCNVGLLNKTSELMLIRRATASV